MNEVSITTWWIGHTHIVEPEFLTDSQLARQEVDAILGQLKGKNLHHYAKASRLWIDEGWRWKLLERSKEPCSACQAPAPRCIYADSGLCAYIYDEYFHLCEDCGYVEHIRHNPHVFDAYFLAWDSYAWPACCPLCDVMQL